MNVFSVIKVHTEAIRHVTIITLRDFALCFNTLCTISFDMMIVSSSADLLTFSVDERNDSSRTDVFQLSYGLHVL